MFLLCHVRVSESIHTLVACNWTRNHSHLVHKQKLNHLWLLICTVHLAVCSYVKHAFHSESSLNSSLNHLASLAKWLSVRLWTKSLWVWVQLQFLRNYSFNKAFWVTEKIFKIRILAVENTKSKHHHWILHIQISLHIRINFQLKQTILIFWTKFAQKG